MGSPRFRQLRRAVLGILLLAILPAPVAKAEDKASIPATRWAEGEPGCTFSRDDDGKYRYGLWTSDLGITLAVDSQELQKVQHRQERLFGLLLTFRYRGQGWLEVAAGSITLEFLKHQRLVHHALDPDDLSARLQDDADALGKETEREVRKHPEQADERKVQLEAYQKEAIEMQEFLATHSLRPAKLDSIKPEVSGWVLFNTKDKWIGGWKTPEEFLLRVPVGKRLFEFPFKLPPREGDLILRKRP
jgi:hypothetical protein